MKTARTTLAAALRGPLAARTALAEGRKAAFRGFLWRSRVEYAEIKLT
jgi:hypothetical protein